MDRSRTVTRPWPTGEPPTFDDEALLELLESARIDDLDELEFGVITTDRTDIVIGYNTFESARAGLAPDRVLGRNLFVDVAPCINNYLVAERFHDEQGVDEQLDYVFTFRMRPTPVRLRLLAAPGSARQYLAIRPR